MRFKLNYTLLLTLFITLFIVSLTPHTIYSDGGFIVVKHDSLVFEDIPFQTAFIIYRDNVEYLIIFSKYTINEFNDTYKAIYYLPLPTKPYKVNITTINSPIHMYGVTIVNKNKLVPRIAFNIPLYVTAGASRHRGYEIEEEFSGENYKILLVKASQPEPNDFLEILRKIGYKGDIPHSLTDVIKYYRDKGWSYFLIGVIKASSQNILMQQFVFQTNEIIYPIYIDRLQGDKWGRINIILITDRVVDKIFDPLKDRYISTHKLFQGIDYKLVIRSDDPKSIIEIAHSFDNIINDHSLSFFDDMIDVKYYINEDSHEYGPNGSYVIKMTFKGLVYKFSLTMIYSLIKNDIIATLRNSRDVSMYIYSDPLFSLAYLTASMISPVLFIVVFILYTLILALLYVDWGSREAYKEIPYCYSITVSVMMIFIMLNIILKVIVVPIEYFPSLMIINTAMLILFFIYLYINLSTVYSLKVKFLSIRDIYALYNGLIVFTSWGFSVFLVSVLTTYLTGRLYKGIFYHGENNLGSRQRYLLLFIISIMLTIITYGTIGYIMLFS